MGQIRPSNTSPKAKEKIPVSPRNFRGFEVSQIGYNNVVCVYNTQRSVSKLKKLSKKCGNLLKVDHSDTVLRLEFSNHEEAIKAVDVLRGHSSVLTEQIVVCRDVAPPLLISGHKEGYLVIRDVPLEIGIPEIYVALGGLESNVTHISFLRTASRNILICTETQDYAQPLLSNKTRIGDWKIHVELWLDFCFHMANRNVVVVENLPQGFDEVSVRQQINNDEGIEYLEVIPDYSCALVYCKSRPVMLDIINSTSPTFQASQYEESSLKKCTVIIGNLHETTQEADVRDLLSDCGNVLKVVVKLDQKTGFKFAKAFFESADSVNKALKLNGSEYNNQTISVNQSFMQKSQPNTVFITNLHRGAQGLHLCLIFQDCGHIESVTIPKQKNIVGSREAATVVFKEATSVEKALEKSNKAKIRGMRIVVSREDPYAHRERRKQSRKRTAMEVSEDGKDVVTIKQRRKFQKN